MRIIVFFTIGFAAACAFGAYAVGYHDLLIFGLVCLIAGLACLLLRKKTARACFLVLLGGALGFAWMHGYHGHYLSALRSLDGQNMQCELTIIDYSNENYYGISATGKIQLQGKSYKVRIYATDFPELQPGDRVSGQMELRATTAQGAAESDYHQSSGLFLVAYVADGAQRIPAEKLEPKYYSAALKQMVLQCIDRCFPADTLGFARALLLGDSRLLSYQQDTAYQLSGIRHVVAVSGLHVSILFSLIYMLAGKKRLLTALLGIPVLVLFAAVAGFAPSVVRACTMQILMILALLLNRDYDPPTALATAVLVMLAQNPMTVMSVSLQLSAGCMVGIFLFCRPIQAWMLDGVLGKFAKGENLRARITRWCITSTSMTLSAMSLTTPVSALYFGMISLIGILTNMLCLWLISGVFYGIMLACVAGAVWLPAGKGVAWLVSVPIRMINAISIAFAKVPFAAVYTSSPYVLIALILIYILFALFFVWKKRKPFVLIVSVVISLMIAIGATVIEPFAGNYLVTVIDVGQGQCVLLYCGDRYYLVDCGAEQSHAAADQTAEFLLSQGITRLDGIILTHYDADHANGVEPLMNRIPTRTLYLPDTMDTQTDFQRELEIAFPDQITWIHDNIYFGTEKWQITIITAQPGKEGNESSLCVLFQRENCDILITGDRPVGGENDLLDTWQIPQLELLIAGHHGSSSSTGLRLLEQTRPEAVAISVGKGNLYDHPNQELLDRLDWFGCRVYRTDIQGHIHFRR